MFKLINALRVALAVSALAAGSAMAAVPADVMTEITTSKTDVTTVGVAVFGVMVAIAVVKWFRKAL